MKLYYVVFCSTVLSFHNFMQRPPSKRKKCGIKFLGPLTDKDEGNWTCIMTNENGLKITGVSAISRKNAKKSAVADNNVQINDAGSVTLR